MGKVPHKIKEKNYKDTVIGVGVLAIIVIVVIGFAAWISVVDDEREKLHEPPEGYEKVLLDGTFAYYDGYIAEEDIEGLLTKSIGVKVYNDVDLSDYTYFTANDLEDFIVTVGKHSWLCDYCE